MVVAPATSSTGTAPVYSARSAYLVQPADAEQPSYTAKPAYTRSAYTVQAASVSAPSTSGARIFASPTWRDVPVATAPPARSRPFAGHDTQRDRNVLFGGFASGAFLDDTWTFDGTRWSKHAPSSSPSPRNGGQMAFLPSTGRTILFGGFNGTITLADTWSWDGASWTQLSPAVSPPTRSQGTLAYSPALGKLVLFGGFGGTDGVYLSDTWTFDGTNWSPLAVTGPAARADSAMAYDPNVGALVLYGGRAGSVYYGDTWHLTKDGWAEQAPAHHPGPRYGHGMAYSEVLKRVVLHGGRDSQFLYLSTWMWTGTDWQRGSVPLSPSFRGFFAMVPAAGAAQILLFGGADPGDNQLRDSHLYDWLGLGLQRNATTEGRNYTDRASYQLDVGSGNLLISGNDLSIPGVGVGVNLTRYFNAKAPTRRGMFGPGWTMSTGRDVYWSGLPDGSVVVYGVRGTAGQLHFARNSDGSFTSPAGINARYEKHSDGTSTLTFNESSQKLTFASNGLLSRHADRNDNAITFAYSSGKLTSLTDTQGRTVTFSYVASGFSGAGYVKEITDNTGRVTSFEYDTSNRLEEAENPLNDTVHLFYDANQAVSRMAELTGNKGFAFAYTPAYNLSRVEYVVSSLEKLAPVSYSYQAADTDTKAFRKTISTNANNASTTYQSSYAGPVLKTTDALGRSRSGTYTANGDVQSAVDAMGVGNTPGNTTTYTYDSLNNPTSATLPTGAAARAEYAASSTCSTTDTGHPYQAKCARDAQDNSAGFSYDGPGNLLEARDTSGGQTGGVALSYTYNPPAGQTPTCGGKPGQRCSETDGNGNRTEFRYDSTGNLTTVIPPAPLGQTALTHDALGRVATATDGKGQKTSYVYDKLDRVTTVQLAGTTSCSPSAGTCVRSGYDKRGNQTSRDDASGPTNYSYDELNRQTQTDPGQGSTTSITYDQVDNVLTFTDGAGTVTYSYDKANQRSNLAEPGGNCGSTPVKCTTFDYDNNANRTSTTYPGNTVLTTVLDNSGRPTQVKAARDSTVFSDFTYRYTAGDGTDRALVQSRTDNKNALTLDYAYDSLARLTHALERNSGGSTTASWLYCYDNAGNRTGESTIAGATCASPSTTYGYNAANQLISRNGSTSGWSYDANGNETAGLGGPGQAARSAGSYNASDQLTSLTVGGASIPFSYAGLGNDERITAGNTSFSNGLLGVTDQTTSGATTHFTREPGGALISQRTGAASYYYLFDAQGSVVGQVDAAGTQVSAYSYDPYGNSRSATSSTNNPYRYISGQLDTATGLYKLGIRYYDPSIGRFTQQDPTGQDDHYIYGRNNPANLVDPSGGFAIALPALGVVAAAAAVAAILVVLSQRGKNRQSGDDPLNGLTSDELNELLKDASNEVKQKIKKILKGRKDRRSRQNRD